MKGANALHSVLLTVPAAATATFLALFPIVNPFGGIPLFFSMTSGFAPEERYRTAMQTAGFVFAILVTFVFLRLGGPLVARLGPSAVGAISRIFGFLILAIAVQLVWDGVAEFK